MADVKRGSMMTSGDHHANGRCIMGDDIPRDGGRLSEYAYTIFLGIDDVEDELVSGRIWSFCHRQPVFFKGLDHMLLTLDRMMDERGVPERWFEPRTLMQKRESRSHNVHSVIVHHKPPDLKDVQGRIGTAAIRIYMRKHASMQGTLRVFGGKKDVSFRSALELLHLMSEWLDVSCAEQRA